jgi:hypothetical protein
MDAKFGTGRSLISVCGSETRTRYRTLLCLEAAFSPDNDHGFLIAPACVMLESELTRMLVEPARTVAADLVHALHDSGKYVKQAAVLDKWVKREIPTTIGIGVLVLLALRKCQEQQVGTVTAFLDSVAPIPFVRALSSNKLSLCLDTIRSQFRNPACHGTTVFDAAAYSRFVELMVHNRRFQSWDVEGQMATEIPDTVRATMPPEDQESLRYWIPFGEYWESGLFHILLDKADKTGWDALDQYEAEWEHSMCAAAEPDAAADQPRE